MSQTFYLFVTFVQSCKSIPQLKMPNDGPSICNSGNPFPAYTSESSTQTYLFSSSARAFSASLLSGLPMSSAITGPCSHFRQCGQCGGQQSDKKGHNSGEEWGRRGEILRKLHTRFALCAMAPRLPPDVAPVPSWWRGCVLAVESLESLATWSVMSVRRRSGMIC